MCKLSNRGDDAYRHDLYGDSITIERRLQTKGSGGYKIRSRQGKVISNKKDDLVAIMDHFNLQMDNPMNVLTQDKSRAFLSSSTPELKYEFFLKGTQLSDLHDEYKTIRANLFTQNEILTRKDQAYQEICTKVDELKERLKDMEQFQHLREKLNAIKDEMAWAQVEELEKEVQDAERKFKKSQERMPQLQQRLEEERQKAGAVDGELQDLDAKLQTLHEEGLNIGLKRDAAKQDHKQLLNRKQELLVCLLYTFDSDRTNSARSPIRFARSSTRLTSGMPRFVKKRQGSATVAQAPKRCSRHR
jgi:chromosome segregation ATPase